MDDDAVEVIAGATDAPIVVSCEHASERLPGGWRWPAGDARLVGTHWAYDLGAADLACSLAAALHAPAVLARFSRLLVDPNRPLDSDTLFRARAEGAPVELNTRALDDRERASRIAHLWEPFHRALDRTTAASHAEVLFSVHTFTPVYEGVPRAVEIGVLFDEEETLARRIAAVLAEGGWRVELNEPWSGKDGLIYSPARHAKAHGRRPVELEVRQDLAVDPAHRAKIVAALTRFFG